MAFATLAGVSNLPNRPYKGMDIGRLFIADLIAKHNYKRERNVTFCKIHASSVCSYQSKNVSKQQGGSGKVMLSSICFPLHSALAAVINDILKKVLLS